MLALMFFAFLGISIAFHAIPIFSIGKKGRLWLYSHEKTSALLVIAVDAFMVLFIGAGNIAGMANLAGGIVVAMWLLIMSRFTRHIAVIKIKRVWLIFPKPTLIIIGK